MNTNLKKLSNTQICLQQFNDYGYCIIPKSVSKDICNFVSEYARLRHKTNPNIIKNKQDPLSGIHREYGDPVMEVLLSKLQHKVEKSTGMSLWPTLSFYYTYTKGNILKKHKDRDSCEVVACLCLGADEKYLKNNKSWPIYLEIDKKDTPIYLQPGDLVLFKGNELTHWREKFQGEWFISAIFAYVAKDGDNSYLKYDQRKNIGDKHIGMFFWLFGILKASIKKNLSFITKKFT